jgi:putative endonuclease
MKKTELGAWGEDRAAEYLAENGFRIICRNFRCRMGEIDLVAEKAGILVFAEVKLRKNSLYGEAREFVTAEKQRKLRLAASFYLAGNSRAQNLQPRFDVLEVYAPQGPDGPVTINHLENAFE